MHAFKTTDLAVQQEHFCAYTRAPEHHLKSVTASAMRFLDRNMNQIPSPAQPAGVAPSSVNSGEHNVVLEGLCLELDSYIHEPRMDHFKTTDLGSDSGVGISWCDPLRYWAVRAFPRLGGCLSAIHTGCRKEVSISLSACDGHPPCAGISRCL
jgi:hypothetical protein